MIQRILNKFKAKQKATNEMFAFMTKQPMEEREKPETEENPAKLPIDF